MQSRALRLKIFGPRGLIRFYHLKVCPRENTNDIILRIFRFISEGISANLSIPPNQAGAVFFRVDGPVSFGSVYL